MGRSAWLWCWPYKKKLRRFKCKIQNVTCIFNYVKIDSTYFEICYCPLATFIRMYFLLFYACIAQYREKFNIWWLHSVWILLWLWKRQQIHCIACHILTCIKKRYSLYFGFHVLPSIAMFLIFCFGFYGVGMRCIFLLIALYHCYSLRFHHGVSPSHFNHDVDGG